MVVNIIFADFDMITTLTRRLQYSTTQQNV